MTLIVGLLGQAGSGKSTVARHLIDRYAAKEYMLAYPLKKLVRTAFPELPKTAVWGSQAEKEAANPDLRLSGRQLMQRIGQGVRAAWGDDFWVQDVLAQIAKEKPTVAVISDVRYINEATLIGAHGPIWRLENGARASIADPTHPSESEWELAPHTDKIVHNGKDLQMLLDTVNFLCRKYVIFPRRPELPL